MPAGYEGTAREHAVADIRTWDIGDPEPPDDVIGVSDYTAPDSDTSYDPDAPTWGRTAQHGWKGYKNGGKTYLDWAELVRRWGPVTER